MDKTIVTKETEDDSNGESQDTLEESIVDRMTKPIETQVAPEKKIMKISDWLGKLSIKKTFFLWNFP